MPPTRHMKRSFSACSTREAVWPLAIAWLKERSADDRKQVQAIVSHWLRSGTPDQTTLAARRLGRSQEVPALELLVEAGTSIRRAVQLSLMEGKPCSERVETALSALRRDLRSRIALEIEKVGPRALIPLFACVAPSLLGLLAWGLYLSWKASGSG